jgi:membrane associated rhomboid family serine protease
MALARILARYWLLLGIMALATGLHSYNAILRGGLTEKGVYTSEDFKRSAVVRENIRLANKISSFTSYDTDVLKGKEEAFGGQRIIMHFTHGFRHINWLHLFVNMAMLLSLGVLTIGRIGIARFALLFFSSMALAAVCYGLVRPPGVWMAGASGGIHGLAGAVIVWAWIDGAGQGRWRLPCLYAAIIALLNAWFWYLTDGKFAWDLHLAGLIIGAATAATLFRKPVSRADENMQPMQSRSAFALPKELQN